MARDAAPIGGYQPEVPATESLPRRITPSLTGVSVGPGISDVGNILEAQQRQSAEQDGVAQASRVMADARLNWTQQLSDRQQAWKPGDDLVGPLAKDFSDYREKALQGVASPAAQRFLDRQLGEFGTEMGERAIQFQAQANVHARIGAFAEALPKASAAVQIDPTQYDHVRTEQLTALSQLNIDSDAKTHLAMTIDKELSTGAALGIAKSDPHSAFLRLADADDPIFSKLEPEARQGIMREAEGSLVTQKSGAILGAYEHGGVVAGTAALASIDKDATIPDDLKDEVRQKANGAVEQWRVQRRQQFAGDMSKLETDIATGDPGHDDIALAHSLYARGAFSPEQLASSLGGIARAQKKGQADDAMIEYAQDAFAKHMALDPTNPDTTMGVALMFTRQTNGVQPGTPEFAAHAVDVTNRVGVVPKPAVNWARAALTGGDPQSAAAGADLLSRLRAVNPRAAGFGIDTKTAAIADSITDAVKAGAPPLQAVNLARDAAAKGDEKAQFLDERFRKLTDTKGSPQDAALTSLMKSDNAFTTPGVLWGRSNALAPTPAMQSDFDTLTKDFFRYNGGDLKSARTSALQDLKRVWGVSQVNGARQIMPYAPEAMFPGLTAPVVRADIAAMVKANAEKLPGVDPAKVRIAPALDGDGDRTARTGGREWHLMAPNKFGMYDVVAGDDGRPLVYELPVRSDTYRAAKAASDDQRFVEPARRLAAEYERQAGSIGPGKPKFAGQDWVERRVAQDTAANAGAGNATR